MSIFGSPRSAPATHGPLVLLTGAPRSGTTLCCHLLDKVPGVVTLHEPMRVDRFLAAPAAADVQALVERFAARTRASLHERRAAVTKHVGGRIPDNPVSDERDAHGERRRVTTRGEIDIGRDLAPGFTLVVKHPSLFTALLPSLAGRFDVYAIVRNPLAVLASWNSVPFQVRDGRLPVVERLVPGFAAEMARLPDVHARQVHAISVFFDRYAELLPAPRILRYEDVVASHGRCLRAIAPAAASLDEGLRSRNANPSYARESMRALAGRLIESPGGWRRFYGESDVAGLLGAALASAE